MHCNVSILVSAYCARDFIEDHLARLSDLVTRDNIIVIAQKNSFESAVAEKYNTTLICTDDIPNVYEAWNIGLHNVQTDYVMNVNTDDILYEDGLVALVSTLNKNPQAALVYGDVHLCKDSIVRPWKRRVVHNIHDLLTHSTIGPMPLWRTSLHDCYGYFDGRFVVAGDYEWWLRLMIHDEIFIHVNAFVGRYAYRSGSIEHRNQQLCAEETRYIRNVYQRKLENKLQLQAARKDLYAKR